MAHIGNKGYVGVGGALEAGFTGADALAIRIDECDNLSSYENPLDAMITKPGNNGKCQNNYKWVYNTNTKGNKKQERFGWVAVSPDQSYVLAAGVRNTGNNNFARVGHGALALAIHSRAKPGKFGGGPKSHAVV